MGCGVASAADLSAKTYKAPPLVAQAYDWTGFYIGGFGGYATENTDGDPKMKGGSAGGTIGYNWQTSNVVFGLEADGGWADINASASTLGITVTGKIDSLGTVRGRVGLAVDQVLFYGTGGYTWADNKMSVSGFGRTASESHFHSGWTVGAGIEAFFAPQWSVKGEYLYRSLGRENYFGVPSRTLDLHSAQIGVNYHFSGPLVGRF
ncbi:outer membrane beta-barrel protein [Bradyrhizobium sp. LTSPM299]|uniref:outer membrane protein n=1 Tax=Bradyrhizobium sp. LTSPM299 TaxID=1619233 RepID=UPI0005C81E23|nr:outer membrane beta-barrel protein [Bradyrhizobium sp. LTSPM299]